MDEHTHISDDELMAGIADPAERQVMQAILDDANDLIKVIHVPEDEQDQAKRKIVEQMDSEYVTGKLHSMSQAHREITATLLKHAPEGPRGNQAHEHPENSAA